MELVDIARADVGIYSLCGDTRSPTPNFEFDLNQFRDPLGQLELRKTCLDGCDIRVQEWIRVDPRFDPILNQCVILVKDYQNGRTEPSKGWISIGFRDHHGTWISRAVACLVGRELASLGLKVGLMHAKGQD